LITGPCTSTGTSSPPRARRARHPGIRLRDIALLAQITERTAHRIVTELVEARYITRHRVGPRSFYEVHPESCPFDTNSTASTRSAKSSAVCLRVTAAAGGSPHPPCVESRT